MATLVARFRDVEEILHREKVFSVSPYLPRVQEIVSRRAAEIVSDLFQGCGPVDIVQTLIRKGTTVFALTWSAMFDPRVLDAPEEFRPGRPDYHYLHFATGQHACYGRYISRIQIPRILKPLLKLAGLRPAGAPEYDGTFPEALMVAADI